MISLDTHEAMPAPVDDDHGVEADDGHGDGGEDDEDHVVHRGDAAHRHRGG